MRKLLLGAVVVGLLAALAGVLSPWLGTRITSARIPDPDSAELRAESARVAQLASQQQHPTGSQCAAKVLRVEAAITWAWVTYRGWQSSNDGWVEAGWSAPVRVDGLRVEVPADGSDYPRSVKKLMPWDLARLALRNPEGARPAEPTLPPRPR
ncbi:MULTISPECIES: hypothetical protein [unclassified Luteococcus]|uniref:hypothetical protein n=1 Tax=unclassified Luteococcus TaxID=2639923 RepID=UPI00313EBDCB